MDDLLAWIKEDEIISCSCLTKDTLLKSAYDRLLGKEAGTYSVWLIYDRVLEEILLENMITYSILEKIGQSDKQIVAVFTIEEE